jgi:hypothetical protein
MFASVSSGAAFADVTVRVEGRPASAPIQVFVRVTDDVTSAPLLDLTVDDFAVEIDGVAQDLGQAEFTQPQEADPDQKVSVVFVMDYTSSVTEQFLDEMQTAVIDFVTAMEPGDMAAIIKFNETSGEQVIQSFVEIDDGANDQLLIDAVESEFPGDGSNILDAVNLGVQQFVGVSLPAGPKAVILVSDGRDSDSDIGEAGVIEAASDASIPIFTIGIGNPQVRGLELLTGLADETGGEYVDATDGGDIGAAYEAVRLLLTGEYLIEIENGITDCAVHEVFVSVDGETETATVPFTRRTCNTTPNDVTFNAVTNVDPGEVVTSNTVTIEGIEAPAHISVINGSYSIGCTATFTTDPGEIADGEEVCVQQTASNQPSTTKTTTLTIGGLAETFTTTTRAQSGGGGGGGGGGGTSGLLELLAGLALLLGRRRLAA